MSGNLDLWTAVERTDPSHVKEITGKAYRGNSPKPHWIVYRATETFGPCGIGWGFSIVEEKLLDGALLDPGFYERIHLARVKVWFDWKGKRGEVEHVGQTVFSGRRRDGKPFTDEDAPKKSVTDALIKALSMVGFAGDIFMGRYDDSKYVAEIAREIDQERRTEAPAPEPKTPPSGGVDLPGLISMGDAAASRGLEILNTWWLKALTKEQRKAVGASRIGDWKVKAAAAEGVFA